MLRKTFRSNNVSIKTKIRLYKIVIRPTVTYACETWVLNRKEEVQLQIWAKKPLRKIFGRKSKRGLGKKNK